MRLNILFVLAMGAIVALGNGRAEAQQLGQTHVVRIPYGASCNWDESDSNNPSWQIPEGWAVIGTKDERSSNYGRTSLNVSFVEKNGHFASSSEVESRFRELTDRAFQYGDFELKARLENEKNRWLNARTALASSHAAISLQVRAQGSGSFYDRKGASIQGNYLVTLRNVGTSQQLQQTLVPFAQALALKRGAAQPAAMNLNGLWKDPNGQTIRISHSGSTVSADAGNYVHWRTARGELAGNTVRMTHYDSAGRTTAVVNGVIRNGRIDWSNGLPWIRL